MNIKVKSIHRPVYRQSTANLNSRVFFIVFFILSFFLLGRLSLSAAETISRDEVLTKYEEVAHLTEKLNIHQEDVLQILPKLRLATSALFTENYLQANRFLDEALQDLSLINSQGTAHARRSFRLEWLELYWGIVQKFAIIALFAFLLVRLPYFRHMFCREHFPLISKIYLTLLLSVAAVFFAFFDVSRYGEAAWVFFDIQVIFVAAGGLLGGIWAGLMAGALVGAFRLILSPQFMFYALIILSVGIIAGFFARGIKTLRHTTWISLFAGGTIGAAHGIAVYGPMMGKLPGLYILMSILFLTFLEGGAIFVFMAIVSGVLDEDARRKMEQELLKTKLLFLQAQISPHFLFNALNTVSAICWREKAGEAQRLILHLAGFFRRALKHIDDRITIKEEMEYIDSYLELEKARYQERLTVIHDYQLSDGSWNVEIPFLVIQPLVENAIEHGIGTQEKGGTLSIVISEDEKNVRIDVIDDGAGTEKGKIEAILSGTRSSAKGGGIGLQNIHQRLIGLYGKEHGLQIETRPGEGMRVTVKIPASEKNIQKKQKAG